MAARMRDPIHLLRKLLTALWMPAGMALVAVVGYGCGCVDPSGTATGPIKDDTAATGYLLHSTVPCGRLFDCQFRCAASLISWNVIATSRSCVEFYQAKAKGRTKGN